MRPLPSRESMLGACRRRGTRDPDCRQSKTGPRGARRLRPHRGEGSRAPRPPRTGDATRGLVGPPRRGNPITGVGASIPPKAREGADRIRDPGRADMVTGRPNVLASKVVRLGLSVLSQGTPTQGCRGQLGPNRGGPPAPAGPVPPGGPRVSLGSRVLCFKLNYSLRIINIDSLNESLRGVDRSAGSAPLPRGGPSGVHGSEFPPRRPGRRRGSDGHPVERSKRGSPPRSRYSPGR